MLKELRRYSEDQGIAFYLKYESDKSARDPLSFLKRLNDNELQLIQTKLQHIHNQLNQNSFQINKINPLNKPQAEVRTSFLKCHQLVLKEIKRRRQAQGENQEANIKSTGEVVLKVIKLLVIGVLGFLFVISLFSSGDDWGEEDSSYQYTENTPKVHTQQRNTQQSVESTVEQESATITESKKEIIQDQELKQLLSDKNSQKNLPTETDLQPDQQKLEFIQPKKKIQFSQVLYIQKPLAYIYDKLCHILPQSVAYFLCAYVFWAAAWILTIALG